MKALTTIWVYLIVFTILFGPFILIGVVWHYHEQAKTAKENTQYYQQQAQDEQSSAPTYVSPSPTHCTTTYVGSVANTECE